MLALRPRPRPPRWTRLAQGQRTTYRALSTPSEDPHSLGTQPLTFDADEHEPAGRLPSRTNLKRERPLKRQSRGTVFVKPWEKIRSLVDVYAIVRVMESRYGPIRDFRALREDDDPSMFKNYFWVEFEKDSDWQEFPADPVNIQVEVPKVLSKPGGVSLDDIRPLLRPILTKDPSPPGHRVYDMQVKEQSHETMMMDIRLEKSDRYVFYKTSREYPLMGRGGLFQTGISFAKWGGFYVPPPVEDAQSGTSQTTQKLERMEKAVASWERAIADRSKKGKQDATLGTEELDDIAQMKEEVLGEVDQPNVSAAPAPEASQPPPPPPELVATQAPPPPEPVAASEQEQEPQTPKMTRRERILAQARESARNQLPEDSASHEQEETPNARAESEKVKADEDQPANLKARLMRLMGKHW